MKLDRYPFNGWDWTELCECWNIPSEDYSDFNIYTDDAQHIKLYLRSCLNYEKSRVMRKTANDIRDYLVELALQDHTYKTPVWEAMSGIEEDFTLIQLTISMIDHMWD